MSNTLGILSGDLIGQRALAILLQEYPWLGQVSSDFSPEMVLLGQTLKVALPKAMTAQTWSASAGYAPQAVEQEQVSLTLNGFVHTTYAFSDSEFSSTNQNLIERFSRAAAHSIGKKLVDSLAALLTEANFPASTEKAAAGFDYETAVDVSKALSNRFVPGANRWMLLNSDCYASLQKDAVLVGNPGSPSDAPRSGLLRDVCGMATSEFPGLPGNSENLLGAAGSPEGLILVCRAPILPKEITVPGDIRIITEPSSGLSIQERSWYNMNEGKAYRSYILLYGVAAGHPDAIQRIVTPA